MISFDNIMLSDNMMFDKIMLSDNQCCGSESEFKIIRMFWLNPNPNPKKKF
jgi:hypothetical protein